MTEPAVSLPVACIRCDRLLENVSSDAEDNQPYAGTAFTSNGHYGSTVFDPTVPGPMLEINICDPCLRRTAERGQVLFSRAPERTYELFVPDGIEDQAF